MSKINRKSSLALAVMAACMLSAPAAFAMDFTAPTPSTLPTVVANIDVKDATTTVALGAIDINIGTQDLIIGRTTGFSVRIDLANGAKFNSIANPAIGAALPGGVVGPPDTRWSVSLAAGGAGQNYVVYSVQPGSGSTGVINGKALSFAAGSIVLDNSAALKTVAGTVGATVTFADPNTAQQILTPFTANVASSADPLKYSMTASSNLNKKVDVGSAVVASKTGFSSDGTLNKSPSEAFFEAGTPTIGVQTGVNAAAGGAFTWAVGDTVDLTVNGTFSAFTATGASVKLVTAGSCAMPTTSINGVVTASQVTFAGVAYSSLNSGTGILCFTTAPSNTAVIDATSISTSVVATRTTTGGTSSASADAMAMSYNGPVAKVYTFNPAGNTTQESFLRISNTGGTGGLVTITGRDDAGAASAGTVSMNLAAGKSIQLTSGDLQNGNANKGLTGALGAGAGKWILTVTGEISGMEVTNLNRNNNSGTVSNLGTPVSGSN